MLFPSYLNLFQVLFVEVLQRVDEVLLHLHVQGVLHLSELTHGFPDVNQSETWKDRGSFSLPAETRICSILLCLNSVITSSGTLLKIDIKACEGITRSRPVLAERHRSLFDHALELTEAGLFSELAAELLHGLAEDDLGLRVARPLLLTPHTRHGVHHAHLSPGGCRTETPGQPGRELLPCTGVYSSGLFSKNVTWVWLQVLGGLRHDVQHCPRGDVHPLKAKIETSRESGEQK